MIWSPPEPFATVGLVNYITDEPVKRLSIATTSADVGNEIASAVNATAALGVQGLAIVSAIKATSISQTVDFASLQLGDKVLHFPAVAGGGAALTCANHYSTGSVTYGTSSGAQTVVINGITISFADQLSDGANATKAAQLITASATLSLIVTAVVDGGDPKKVDITAIAPGTAGNYTLAVTGTGATRSNTTLTGGATAGELPIAAVVNDMYIVCRPVVAPAASAVKF